jgi:hypothetical protein
MATFFLPKRFDFWISRGIRKAWLLSAFLDVLGGRSARRPWKGELKSRYLEVGRGQRGGMFFLRPAKTDVFLRMILHILWLIFCLIGFLRWGQTIFWIGDAEVFSLLRMSLHVAWFQYSFSRCSPRGDSQVQWLFRICLHFRRTICLSHRLFEWIFQYEEVAWYYLYLSKFLSRSMRSTELLPVCNLGRCRLVSRPSARSLSDTVTSQNPGN